jgi:hypothetical protein
VTRFIDMFNDTGHETSMDPWLLERQRQRQDRASLITRCKINRFNAHSKNTDGTLKEYKQYRAISYHQFTNIQFTDECYGDYCARCGHFENHRMHRPVIHIIPGSFDQITSESLLGNESLDCAKIKEKGMELTANCNCMVS